jgi:hypothetical protein
MGMNTAPARRPHRKAQVDRKRRRHLAAVVLVLVVKVLAVAVLALVGVALATAAVVVTDDLNPPCKHNGLHRQYVVEAVVLL